MRECSSLAPAPKVESLARLLNINDSEVVELNLNFGSLWNIIVSSFSIMGLPSSKTNLCHKCQMSAGNSTEYLTEKNENRSLSVYDFMLEVTSVRSHGRCECVFKFLFHLPVHIIRHRVKCAMTSLPT